MFPDKIQQKLLQRQKASILGDSFPRLLPMQFSEYIVSAIKTFPKRLNIYTKMYLISTKIASSLAQELWKLHL